MSTEIATNDLVASRFLAVASEAEAGFGKLLKFTKGHYYLGDDEVPSGHEFVAQMPSVAHGWVKFIDGKLVEQRIGKVADGFMLARREELGDTDETQWEKDSTGKPRDPWGKQWYVPLVALETGEMVVFCTGSRGGSQTVSKLCAIYGRQARNGLPIIRLNISSYKHREFGRIEIPDLAVVSWEKQHDVSAPSIADEMNDSVVF